MTVNSTLSVSVSDSTNNTANLGFQSNDFVQEGANLHMVTPIVLISVGILIAFENSLVLVAAFGNKTVRENIHYSLVLSLSVSDLVLGINAIFHGVINLRVSLSIGAKLTLCRLSLCLGSIAFLISVWQTFYISLNRYLVITENKLNQCLWKGKRKYIVYAATWVAHLILYVLKLAPKDDGGTDYEELCNPISMYGEHFAVWNTIFSVSITISLLSTFLFYSLALWNVRKRYRKTENQNPNCSQESGIRQQMAHRQRKRIVKSMKLVAIVLLVLILSLCPTLALGFVFDMSPTEFLVLICFSLFHSVVNPIIYCIQMEDFRKEVQKMFNLPPRLTVTRTSSVVI